MKKIKVNYYDIDKVTKIIDTEFEHFTKSNTTDEEINFSKIFNFIKDNVGTEDAKDIFNYIVLNESYLFDIENIIDVINADENILKTIKNEFSLISSDVSENINLDFNLSDLILGELNKRNKVFPYGDSENISEILSNLLPNNIYENMDIIQLFNEETSLSVDMVEDNIVNFNENDLYVNSLNNNDIIIFKYPLYVGTSSSHATIEIERVKDKIESMEKEIRIHDYYNARFIINSMNYECNMNYNPVTEEFLFYTYIPNDISNISEIGLSINLNIDISEYTPEIYNSYINVARIQLENINVLRNKND